MRSLITTLMLSSCTSLCAQDGSLDLTFNPDDIGNGFGFGPYGHVHACTLQPDGKTILGGTFDTYNGTLRSRIVRANSDGTLDTTFDPGTGANDTVSSIVVQPDGKVIIGGAFTSYNGLPRNHLVRLNADGSLDATFTVGSGTDAAITSMALQGDGKLLIAGWFSSFNGIPRGHIARINTNGTVDNTFALGIGADGPIQAVRLRSDGRIVIGGSFTAYNGIDRNRIAQLTLNGSLDTTFDPGTGTDATVHAVIVQPNNMVIIGGEFGSVAGITKRGIARMNANGSLDNGYATGYGVHGIVRAMALRADGKCVLAGDISHCHLVARQDLAQLNSDGSLDLSFDPAPGTNQGTVFCLSLAPDNRALIGGSFTRFNDFPRDFFTYVLTNGAVDQTFNGGSGAVSGVYAVAPQADGKVIIAGDFTAYNGDVHNYVARVDTDGSADNGFNLSGPDLGYWTLVRATVVQPDGKVIFGGRFESFNGVSRQGLARVNADGSLDLGFNTGTGVQEGGEVWEVIVQPDNKILIAGFFSTYNGTQRRRVARLNSDGTLDATFDPGNGANSTIRCALVQPDGKVIIGGDFTTYNGSPRNRIARLNVDGSLDTSFDPGSGTDGAVHCVALMPNGHILIGGYFTSYNGTPRGRIARLMPNGPLDASFNPGTGANSQVLEILPGPDGKCVVAGNFTSYNGTMSDRIARIAQNGTLDPSFASGTGANDYISSLAFQSDGRLLLGGGFTSYNGIGRNCIARLNGTPRAGIKVMLEGPYSGTSMTDALRTLPSFPLTEPFTAMGYAETGFTPGATIGSSVLTTTGNNAIVDWVLVEMRPVATPGIVAASRAVLLQRDGDVVDLDGVSMVGFAGLAPGNYCVAVKPRNHLPVMLSTTTPISYGAAIATVDFTLPTTQVYDNDARKNVGGVMVLAAGDVSFNETVRYTGSGNDRDPILTRVGSTAPNNTVSGYWREDVNMDGVVKYTGSANDRDIILTNVGSTTPNNTRVAALP